MSTSNMNLPLSVVGTTPAPDWAEQLNVALQLIDSHTHVPGESGVAITPDGLDISADLSMQDNNLLAVRSINFSAQDSPLAEATDLGCIYVAGVDLYYNDEDGNQVRITQEGAIAGTPGSIANLAAPASASYNSGTGTFIWQSDVDTAAAMDSGPLSIREMVANANSITIQSPNSLAADYTLTLPGAVPATTNALLLTNTSGVQSFLSKGAANTVLQMDGSGSNLEYGLIEAANIDTDAVTTSKILDANVTGDKIEDDVTLNGNAIRIDDGTLQPLVMTTAGFAATHNTRTLMGEINAAGAVARGNGFSSSLASVNEFTVSFNTSFADTPIVVCTVSDTGATGVCSVFSISSSQFKVRTVLASGGGALAQRFCFMATGSL